MTLNAPSFFAGIGTVLGLLVVGFGGGVMMSGVISDKTPREPNRIEKRAAETAKAPVIETKPATAAVPPAPPVVPPAPPAADPTPTPQIQQAGSPAPAPTQPTEPQPAPQVRHVALPPPPAAQVQEVKPEPEPAAPSRMSVRQVPLGPEHPVALPIPAHDAAAAKHEARKRAQEAQKLEKKRQQQERKLAEQRRRQSIKEAQDVKAAAERSRPQAVDDDDDDRDERPTFFRREREAPFGRPFFRMFGDND
ncbi:MAG: hypothetical protein E6G97_21530 [Alphaproteobacteria bacterium]|nr:MAG: hypothetical protein E6G97_21530 [Alphaproteobacteria bacterium]